MLDELFSYLGKLMEDDNSSKSTNGLWSKKRISVRHASDSAILAVQPPVIGKFYVSSYGCPYCNKPLFKTVFPIGEEYPIKTTDGTIVEMKRVFTCMKCQTFMTAAKDLLSDGVVYELQERNNSRYKSLLNKMNSCGTTQGRPD